MLYQPSHLGTPQVDGWQKADFDWTRNEMSVGSPVSHRAIDGCSLMCLVQSVLQQVMCFPVPSVTYFPLLWTCPCSSNESNNGYRVSSPYYELIAVLYRFCLPQSSLWHNCQGRWSVGSLPGLAAAACVCRGRRGHTFLQLVGAKPPPLGRQGGKWLVVALQIVNWAFTEYFCLLNLATSFVGAPGLGQWHLLLKRKP
ncbi:uncharacterized protein LOC117795646 isoform X3 [Ailuropoda melanoleuca]|uniref:uncharacterized protein LOC117795646 isoform X3 n=1 Tax=Ailuropoda melanoleuca TaxID=9646 RepID=UPI001494F8DC|nr:uncharacterized protein LOC117795646 isoform X3 [Ailuropoda melanoleuca]XP_034496810.1 uncharacterized protein LOC117795646 isoform X3 [Ailuropoda melanoleuca]